jgi:hypothetical protein
LSIDPDRITPRGVEDPVNETNTVVFKMDIACRREADGTMVNDKGTGCAGNIVDTWTICMHCNGRTYSVLHAYIDGWKVGVG